MSFFSSLDLFYSDSDAYGISGSGSGYDLYAPLSNHFYGRMRAQLAATNGHMIIGNGNSNGPANSSNSSSNLINSKSNNNSGNNKSNGNIVNSRRTGDKVSGVSKKSTPPALIYPERYATEWD